MKRCTKCGIEKPEEAFGFQASRGKFRSECKECKAKVDKAWMARRKQNPPPPKYETKECNTCHVVKPISEFSPNAPGYFHGRCKACIVARHKEKRREQYRNNPTARFFWPFENESGVMVKRCTRCYAEKPVSEFYTTRNAVKNKRGDASLHSKCKECDKAIRRAAYEANPEKYREYARKNAPRFRNRKRVSDQRWRAANRTRLRQQRRNRVAANPERYHASYLARKARLTPEVIRRWYLARAEKALEWRKANRERLREAGRTWRKANPHKHAENVRRRQARKLNAPIIEKIDRIALIERDKWTCYLCGVTCTPQNVTLDHVVPLYRGGSHTADNLRVACRSCNCSKGPKLLCEFLK